MSKLLQIELQKLLPYRTFWVILFIYSAFLLLFAYASSHITINGQQSGSQIYQFPGIWMKLSYVASYFNLLLGILLIILITDEYAFRTFRQHVIDGLFRKDLVASKYLVILLVGLIATTILTLIGLVFGITYNQHITPGLLFSGSMHVVYYLVQAIGYMSIAVLFGFLIRKNGLAIISFLGYTKIVEPLIHWRLNDNLDQYFPMKVLSSLTPMPGQEVLDVLTGPTSALNPQQAVLPAILYIGLFYALAYLVLKVRDL
ncbi:ABC transporter permease subunit [Adhaeribacter rhizoryzae]|uniref:ABC transporter permease n=1 Tax=Adhaeribacter rhizoryzae TaxID=2607907 RepID=A0A5M6DPP4_9BACT|nr:ABC transporter permease [Adhaeribacter rhizoryzae]KAA5548179.1 ABC transporter permease [Adhaeribacter rhizoryzae]